mmetsp:Transcript_26035/g.60175  ORF Transcript_26035/g.60175 Transcript_26035/m.60175 type:complete len:294 (-) Transcript_26035:40-921(-)
MTSRSDVVAGGVAAVGQQAVLLLNNLSKALASVPVDIHLGTTEYNVKPASQILHSSPKLQGQQRTSAEQITSVPPSLGQRLHDDNDDDTAAIATAYQQSLQETGETVGPGWQPQRRPDSQRVESFRTDPGGNYMLSRASSFATDGKVPQIEPLRQAQGVKPVLEETRDDWLEGSIVEVFSSSAQQWFAAYIAHVLENDMLCVKFIVDDAMKQKVLARDDPQLATLGENGQTGTLPAGFHTQESQSRPGQLVYVDSATGKKYATLALAWSLHFERSQCNHDRESNDGIQAEVLD